jgi:hypothetical protein
MVSNIEKDSYRDYYKGDLLAYLLLKKLTPLNFSLIIILVSVIFSLILSLFATGPDYFLKNWNSLVWVFIITPLIAGFYLWGSGAMLRLIESLRESNAVKLDEDDFDLITNIYKSPWRQVLSFLISIPLSVTYYSLHYTKESSIGNKVLVPVIGHSLSFFLGSYVTLMLIFSLCINIFILYKLFKGKEINVAHPCPCSGLKVLSDYSLKTAYLAALFALMISIFLYRYGDFYLCDIQFTSFLMWGEKLPQGLCNIKLSYLMIYMGVPLYILAAISCFFLPLYTAHLGMKASKERIMNEISIQFKNAYQSTRDNLSDLSTVGEGINKIKQIRDFYEITEQLADWPFDFSKLRNFILSVILTVSAVISPIITPAIIEYINKILQNFINLF